MMERGGPIGGFGYDNPTSIIEDADRLGSVRGGDIRMATLRGPGQALKVAATCSYRSRGDLEGWGVHGGQDERLRPFSPAPSQPGRGRNRAGWDLRRHHSGPVRERAWDAGARGLRDRP